MSFGGTKAALGLDGAAACPSTFPFASNSYWFLIYIEPSAPWL